MSLRTLTRRALIAGAGTAVASAALAAPYVTAALPIYSKDGDAEFLAMFEAWRTAYILACDNCDDVECDKLRTIEKRMGFMRPGTATGFAVKLLIMTSYGDFDLDNDPAQTLFADAIAITGLPSPMLARA